MIQLPEKLIEENYFTLNARQRNARKKVYTPELRQKINNTRRKRMNLYLDIYHERQNIYKKQMRDIAKQIGMCSCCFKNKPSRGFKMCDKCRNYYKELKRTKTWNAQWL